MQREKEFDELKKQAPVVAKESYVPPALKPIDINGSMIQEERIAQLEREIQQLRNERMRKAHSPPAVFLRKTSPIRSLKRRHTVYKSRDLSLLDHNIEPVDFISKGSAANEPLPNSILSPSIMSIRNHSRVCLLFKSILLIILV